MAIIFEKGPEARTEKEAELLDKKQELAELPRQIDAAVQEVAMLQKQFEDAKAKLQKAKDNLDALRRRDDKLSEEVAEAEKTAGLHENHPFEQF